MIRDQADQTTVDFLACASRVYRVGESAFTGFHWPVLAAEVAARLRPGTFVHYLESGFACNVAASEIPTSTTDQYAYAPAQCFHGNSCDVLLALAPRFDRVVLDAPNVDLRGQVNTTAVGPIGAPNARLPGGGGASDVAFGARELVLLFGGPQLGRIRAEVEHVTSSPGPATQIRLLTRWGSLHLGAEPSLVEVADLPGADTFVAHLVSLGVATEKAVRRRAVATDERDAAAEVLREAADRGYVVARSALKGSTAATRRGPTGKGRGA
jgi:glutaconate CoA-transferase, subunit B